MDDSRELDALRDPDEAVLRDDALFFARLLRVVYGDMTMETLDEGLPLEVVAAEALADDAAGRPRARGQGMGLSGSQRAAVELRAMQVVREHLGQLGWEVSDTSKSKPYDFVCTRETERLYVEVKGTTSAGEAVVLTRNEVEHHRRVYPSNALAVVHGIRLSGADRTVASGGEIDFVSPWEIEDHRLRTISYTYDRR